MPKGRQGVRKQNGSRVKTAAVILCILLICFVALAAVCLFSDGFDGRVPLFSVNINGRNYYWSGSGLGKLESGTEVRVKAPFGNYGITVTANGDPEAKFLLDGEETDWRSIEGKDFTGVFEIEETDGGFILGFSSLSEILCTVFGEGAMVIERTAGELFTLKIRANSYTYAFPFGIGGNLPPEGLIVDPDEIVV